MSALSDVFLSSSIFTTKHENQPILFRKLVRYRSNSLGHLKKIFQFFWLMDGGVGEMPHPFTDILQSEKSPKWWNIGWFRGKFGCPLLIYFSIFQQVFTIIKMLFLIYEYFHCIVVDTFDLVIPIPFQIMFDRFLLLCCTMFGFDSGYDCWSCYSLNFHMRQRPWTCPTLIFQ